MTLRASIPMVSGASRRRLPCIVAASHFDEYLLQVVAGSHMLQLYRKRREAEVREHRHRFRECLARPVRDAFVRVGQRNADPDAVQRLWQGRDSGRAERGRVRRVRSGDHLEHPWRNLLRSGPRAKTVHDQLLASAPLRLIRP